MKPAVKDDPALEAAAVKFLKFLTVPENISMIVEEQGSSLGAVKGSTYNSVLDDWLDQSFPIVPETNWPLAFNSEQNDKLNRLFGEWVLGRHTDDKFFEQVNTIQQAGAGRLHQGSEHRYFRLELKGTYETEKNAHRGPGDRARIRRIRAVRYGARPNLYHRSRLPHARKTRGGRAPAGADQTARHQKGQGRGGALAVRDLEKRRHV